MSKKINLMIIGAQKAGTTALKNYLNEHPNIIGHPQMEFDFFLNDEEYNQGFDYAFNKYFSEGDKNANNQLVAKHVSAYYEEKILSRLAAHNPDCKLVFIIREPVARAYSSYGMEMYFGQFKRNSLDMIDVIKKKDYNDSMYRIFIRLGLYDEQIQMIYKYFPKENVKIVLYEDLNKSSLKVCQDVFQWMGVDVSFVPNVEKKYNETKKAKSQFLTNFINFLRSNNNVIKKVAKAVLPYSVFSKMGNSLVEYNKSEKKLEPIPQELYSFLHDFYQPHNENFERLTGINLSHWNKKA